jgi:branched-chain amino acid transport system substrate-binding protein
MTKWGQDEYNGLALWAKWVNAQGGIRGGDGNVYEVELVIYSDESKPENVSRLYEKLITEDKVDFLVGPVWAPLGMATVAAVEKYKKLELFGTATYDPELYKDWKYVVHVCTNGTEYLKNITDMILQDCVPKDPEAKNVAIIHGDALFEKVCGVWGYKHVKEKGFNVVFYEQYPTPPTDLTPVLTRVKAAKPAILLAAEGGLAGAQLITRQCREIGLDLKLLWPGTAAVFQEYYDAMGKYGEDIICNTQWEPGVRYPVTYGPDHDWYVSNFRKEFNVEPAYASSMGFTQGLALQAGMEKSKEPLNSDAVRKALNTVEFTGFYGKFKIDPNTGFQIGHGLAMMQWQDGKKVPIWPPEVATAKLRYPMKKWAER